MALVILLLTKVQILQIFRYQTFDSDFGLDDCTAIQELLGLADEANLQKITILSSATAIIVSCASSTVQGANKLTTQNIKYWELTKVEKILRLPVNLFSKLHNLRISVAMMNNKLNSDFKFSLASNSTKGYNKYVAMNCCIIFIKTKTSKTSCILIDQWPCQIFVLSDFLIRNYSKS